MKMFLTGGHVPVDSTVSEQEICIFRIGQKNRMFHNATNDVSASAMLTQYFRWISPNYATGQWR